MQEYPDAKVIVTLRDADSWWKSVIGSIHSDGPHEHAWGKKIRPIVLEEKEGRC